MRKFLLLIIITVLFLSLVGFSLAQRPLEVEYPAIEGYAPVTTETALPEYVKYIFNFSILILGLVAFGVLVWAGIQYLTSAGSPEIRKNAKSQILSALLGIAILLLSYLILTTINPQLVILGVPELREIEAPPLPSPTRPVSPDPLVRIRELAENIKDNVALNLKQEAENLKPKVEQCDCGNSNSECDCIGLSCQAIRCYGDPCPNREVIKNQQRTIVALIDEILYYKNRISSEKEDIGPELEHFIYWERLTEAQCDELVENLENLITKIKEVAVPSQALTKLPSQCLPDPCTAHCRESSCHDTPGCHPEECTGGNPCPLGEIDNKIQEVNNVYQEISQICQNIINILE